MHRDAAATRRRLLDAARDEFSRYGIAGARVDRIATAARSNKAQIYHYFGSKEALFDAVLDETVRQTLAEVPIDPTDLPEYAARLHDSYRQRPWAQRLLTWERLERGDRGARLMETVRRSGQDGTRSVARAQAARTIGTGFSAEELVALVLQIAALWSMPVLEYAGDGAAGDPDRQRHVVRDAVAALLTTPGPTDGQHGRGAPDHGGDHQSDPRDAGRRQPGQHDE